MIPFIELAAALLLSSATASPRENPKLPKDLAQTIAPLFSLTIQDYFIASRWDRPGTANAVEFRSVIPFEAWGQENLVRVNIPFRTESELGPGLSDVRVFDLIMFKHPNGIWGIGPVINLGINKGPGSDEFQAGPVLTYLWTSIRGLSIGILSQNFFSSQTSLSAIQPILAYQPAPLWTIGLGELPLVYNWKKGAFVVTSFGLQLGYLARIGAQPVRFFVNPQFNTTSSSELYHWTITSGVTFPLQPIVP